MVTKIVDAELWRSLRYRGFDPELILYSDYEIGEGWIRPNLDAGATTSYSPMEHAELPEEFSRLASGDLDQVLSFVRRYGTLGGIRDADGYNDSDPADWLISHARAVRFILELGARLDDRKSLLEFLAPFRAERKKGKTRFQFEVMRRGYRGKCVVVLGARGRMTRPKTKWTPKETAVDIICLMLNINLAGCVPQIAPSGLDLPLKLGFDYECLIDCIYFLTAQAVVSGRLRLCADCGQPFFTRNDRIRYCPPRPGLHKATPSPCMNRAKVRRWRQRNSVSGNRKS